MDIENFKKRAAFPHCDSNILHKPKDCTYCDHYPERQQQRIVDKINFTGNYEEGFEICPSEQYRKLEDIEKWPGNVKNTYIDKT